MYRREPLEVAGRDLIGKVSYMFESKVNESSICTISYKHAVSFSSGNNAGCKRSNVGFFNCLPYLGPVGSTVVVSGAGFQNALVSISFDGTVVSTTYTDAYNGVNSLFTVPSISQYTVTAQDNQNDYASTTFTVTTGSAPTPTASSLQLQHSITFPQAQVHLLRRTRTSTLIATHNSEQQLLDPNNNQLSSCRSIHSSLSSDIHVYETWRQQKENDV